MPTTKQSIIDLRRKLGDPLPHLPVMGDWVQRLPALFQANLYSHGGRLKDYPNYRDNLATGRRELKATITSWVGTSAWNATHYKPMIELRDIPFFDEAESAWRTCWDHPQDLRSATYKPSDLDLPVGLYLPPSERYDGYQSPELALGWITFALLKHFPPHKFAWDTSALEPWEDE